MQITTHPSPPLQQINAPTQTLLTQVSYIYQHPYHYTYVLHKNDCFLHLYDVATMDVVGRTKVIVLDQMKLFAFTLDFNVIYGLRQSRFLCFQLTSSQWLTHQPVQSPHEPRPYFESYYLSFYPKRHILICVTTSNFFFVNPNMNSAYKPAPLLFYEQQQIFPEKVAEISPHVWVIGCKGYVYFMRFSESYEAYDVFGRLVTGNIVRLATEHHPKREFIYVINDKEEVFLVRVNQKERKLELCYKFYNEQYTPMYLTILRLGINTSTTDKLRNRIYLNIYCEEKQVVQKMVQENQENQEMKMVDQNIEAQKQLQQQQELQKQPQLQQSQQLRQPQPAQKQYSLIILPTDTQYPTEFPQQQFGQRKQFSLSFPKQSFIVKNMPALKISPWINIFTQNCLMFLTNKKEICSINFCSIPEINLKADQWICMGYKFQNLERNIVYEEKEEEFQDQSLKEEKALTKEFLDDWSQSNMPKNIILNHTYNRMRSIDI